MQSARTKICSHTHFSITPLNQWLPFLSKLKVCQRFLHRNTREKSRSKLMILYLYIESDSHGRFLAAKSYYDSIESGCQGDFRATRKQLSYAPGHISPCIKRKLFIQHNGHTILFNSLRHFHFTPASYSLCQMEQYRIDVCSTKLLAPSISPIQIRCNLFILLNTDRFVYVITFFFVVFGVNSTHYWLKQCNSKKACYHLLIPWYHYV